MQYISVRILRSNVAFHRKCTQILCPLPIGFAVFLVHMATIPITGTGINPARSLGATIIYNRDIAWDGQVSILMKNLIKKPMAIYSIDR